jgi:tRNA G18 (ribose-2'-O)-methylase SpoU
MRKLKNEELNRLSLEEIKKTKKHPVALILDNVRSRNNVGAAFRTADAFLVDEILLCGITARPPHREIHKTALGATESVSWSYYASTIEAVDKMKYKGFIIVAVEQADKKTLLQDYKPDAGEKLAFVFGNEIYGVSDEVIQAVDLVVELPQYGTKHSLNISVTIGVVLWDVLNKMHLLK